MLIEGGEVAPTQFGVYHFHGFGRKIRQPPDHAQLIAAPAQPGVRLADGDEFLREEMGNARTGTTRSKNSTSPEG